MEVRAELRRGQLAASDATPPPPPVRRKVSDENREMASASLAARATGDGVRARRAPREAHSPPAAPRRAPGVDYYLVLDFEATCDENDATWVNEIIEFPDVRRER